MRDIDFEPFAFQINGDGLPELVEDYQPNLLSNRGFTYAEMTETQHRTALEKNQ
jgi:hypothetical protein